VLITIAVVLLALLFIRDLRSERAAEHAGTVIEESRTLLRAIHPNLEPPDALLVGPGRIRAVAEQFSARASGDMLWFHVCLSMRNYRFGGE
jgi:hypothetical protein